MAKTETESMRIARKAREAKELAEYFRPPEGKFSRDMMIKVQKMGYKTVFWSFAYADWDNAKQPTPQKALQCIEV